MRIALFGAGEKSKYAKTILEKYEHNVLYYIEDSNFAKIGLDIEGIPVISIFSVAKYYRQGEIDAVVITTEYFKRTVQDMIASCQKIGIADKDICLININLLRGGEFPQDGGLSVPWKDFVQIYDLNFHLTDNCNMNCELCCHSSQFVEDEAYANLNSFKNEIKQLHELIPNIHTISLLGGEPLLHPDVKGFIETTRKTYPYATILLVTNGILLRGISKELVNCIKNNDVIVSVSLYPPMHEQLDDLLWFFRKNNIKWSMKKVDTFFKKYTDKPLFDARETTSYCGYCTGFRHGKLAKCIDSMTIGYTNKKFGLNIPEPNTINIYKPDVTAIEIMEFLERPMEICKYCASKQTLTDFYEWKQVNDNTKKEDFLFY